MSLIEIKTMIFGGLQKTSFIDYSGKISCVIFLLGCNFDCPYCHNPDLIKDNGSKSSFLDELTIYHFLEKRKDFIDGVVISGGEPTLQKNLISFCKNLRQMDYEVKLDTNGSMPQVIRRLINEGLIDYIAMDIKTDPYNYSPIIKKDYDPRRTLSSIQLIMESAV
ncbi:anaerobic ribonucleoside-triphosphate reductase activating protein, partial [Thermodesulfobacteriota bacterium]